MQPLVLHPPSLTTAQFGQPRFDSGPERLLNRPWTTTNARGCSPRAPLSRQSMSGSPHTEEPSVTPGESNPVVYAPVTSPTRTPTSTAESPIPALSGPSLPPAAVSDSLPAPNLPRYGDQAPASTLAYPGSPVQHQHHQHQHQHHHHHHQQLHHHPGGPSYPLSALESNIAGPSNRSLGQKSTRRTKAHVASACVNCKKKHLGCDPARPCRRCVLAGKASSCVDVTHKKRGRPPLKAEDSSLRSYTTHMENPNASVEAQSSMAAQRNVLHRATSSRELRPMTDLQTMGEPSPTPATMRIARNQPHRWSASVFPLTRPMDPSPPMTGSAGGRRPFSSSGPASYAAVPPHPPPPSLVPMTSGFNPVLNTPVAPPGMDRRYPTYAGPALPPPTSPPQHPPAGTPYIPYTDSPASSIHQPLSDPRMPPGPREPYLESPVRLPPIHQATASPVSHHAHRLSDPYPATWISSSSSREENREPRSPVTLQRPMGSLFSHTTTPRQHQRSASSTGPLDPIPRHLGPIDLPSPIGLGHSPPVSTQATQYNTEAEAGEQRPIKRRKMALDDMVNG